VREQVEAMLEAAGITVADAPLVSDSILLASPVSALTELGAFRQGLFHLQDPASTLVTKYASIPEGAQVADVCAAPGGKSAELSRRAGAVFSSDFSFARLRRTAPESVVTWRGRLRRLLPCVVAADGGFLLAYLVVALFVFPAGVIPQDMRVPNVIGLTYNDAVQQLQQKGFTAERGESRFH